MADALVSFALENLMSIARQELSLSVGATEDIERLCSNFTAIRAVLRDAESRQVREEGIKDWLAKLKDVAYDVGDVLDVWRTESLRSESNRKVKTNSQSPVFCFTQLRFRRKVVHDIMKIREKLDLVSNEKNSFSFHDDHLIEASDRQTSCLIDEEGTFGRELEKEEIVSFLLSEASQEETSGPLVVSIVGMGGLGKTTLAQQAYNDTRVREHFDIRIWVCVSEYFDVKGLTKTIIEDVTKSSCDLLELNPLQQKLCELLDGKQFLLVLDDIWEENQDKCEKLKLPLKRGGRGSRIVLTTRNDRVAMVMGTTHKHNLGALSEKDCWSLFRHRAFVDRTTEEHLMLESIGRGILKKCKGVPLVAKVIGSAMRFKKTKQEWECVFESEIWDLEEVGESIYPPLLFSYYNLPSKLKQCFAYCSVFPKDHVIEYDVLIKLWMAQGFICPEGEKVILEEIGGNYFSDLLGRSLFQDVVRGKDGGVLHFKMHDMVHDLAQFIAKGECQVIESSHQHERQIKAYERPIKARHLYCSRFTALPNFWSYKNLRTFILRGWLDDRDAAAAAAAACSFLSQLRYLRVLDLSPDYSIKLFSAVGKLKLIRYIDLSNSSMVEVPESMTSLYNLQTLRLNRCQNLRKLPKGIGKLINLRHLEFEDCGNLCYLPKGIEKLSSLQTLTRFIVGSKKSACTLAELKNLNLCLGDRRRLEITNLERAVSVAEAKEARLNMKINVHRLLLHCEAWSGFGGVKPERVEDVFKVLQPNSNLKELEIKNYMGCKFPSWMEYSLFSNLSKVELVDCYKCTQLPALGQLPSLEYLSMCGFSNLRQVGHEFYGIRGAFPKLEALYFYNMGNLEEWELRMEDGEMPCLQYLHLDDCPKLKAFTKVLPNTLIELLIDSCGEGDWMSCIPPSVEKLTLAGLDEMQLRKLPSLRNLKFLNFTHCRNLTSLPNGVDQLEKLENLVIAYCHKLSSLQELQHLTNLQELNISHCQLLKERCEKERGEDWHKIDRIPNIKIDSLKIQ